jgi:hypothetical protein
MLHGHPGKLPKNLSQVYRNLARDGIGGFVTQALDAIEFDLDERRTTDG